MEEKKKVNKKLLFNVITFIVAFSLAFFVTKKFMSGNGVNSKIKAEIEAANKKCPMKVHEFIRMDSIKLMNPKLIHYYYTMLAPKDSISDELRSVTTKIQEEAQHKFDTDASMKMIRENNISLNYIYNDINGERVVSFTLKPHPAK
jgi:hypothetical protein